MGNSPFAPRSAKFEVSADGSYTIPTEAAIKLVRNMFEGVGVDRLRADRYFLNLPFSDVSQLDDTDLAEAIAVGLNYLTDPMREQAAIKDALLKQLDTQFSRKNGRFIYSVGSSYKMVWPNHRTLAH
ncbi:hypothetical protein GTP23_20550 [Pseudoduganella sp. FT93W]|uniref:Uncharacterized protein n=1 Tax=Duganella fentianensis TaxID=2692177 RepID=A0A845I2H9_9BURK|nr:hypothetical protein [Duganella fentianensis]MYN47439.1 hypothetical protein [Duganella fentianensis]